MIIQPRDRSIISKIDVDKKLFNPQYEDMRTTLHQRANPVSSRGIEIRNTKLKCSPSRSHITPIARLTSQEIQKKSQTDMLRVRREFGH